MDNKDVKRQYVCDPSLVQLDVIFIYFLHPPLQFLHSQLGLQTRWYGLFLRNVIFATTG
jgi:hypothetical protein